MDDTEYKYLIAVATSDGIVINRHFGKADEFLIIGVDENNDLHRIGKRTVSPVCDGGNHDDKKLETTARIFSDCKYILASKIGQGAACVLESLGITPMELPGIIEESIHRLLAYEEIQKLF